MIIRFDENTVPVEFKGKRSFHPNVKFEDREDARNLAAYLNKTDEDGWSYEVHPTANVKGSDPWYQIYIFDEEDVFVVKL